MKADAARRSRRGAALVRRIEVQLSEQMARSAAAQRALQAAEEIQGGWMVDGLVEVGRRLCCCQIQIEVPRESRVITRKKDVVLYGE